MKLNNKLNNLLRYTHISKVVDCYFKECVSIPQLNSSKTTSILLLQIKIEIFRLAPPEYSLYRAGNGGETVL
jgi:hypothetical protein